MSLTLRITSIVAYEGCPAQYFFREVRRVPSPPGQPMLFGTAGHDVLEAFNKGHLASGSPPPFSALRPALVEAVRKHGLSGKDAKLLAVLLFKYHQRYGKLLRPREVETRRFLEFDRGCLITGKSDLVTSDEVVDYKFSRVRRTRRDVALDLQLGFYARLFDKAKARIVRLSPVGSVTSIGAAAMPREAVLDRIGCVVEAIRRGRYPPNSQFKWCSKKLCAFWSMCRGKKSGQR